MNALPTNCSPEQPPAVSLSRMPLRKGIVAMFQPGLLAAATARVVILTASILLAGSVSLHAQSSNRPPIAPEKLKGAPDQKTPPAKPDDTLPDYRNRADIRRSREARQESQMLPLFGYNYFEAARQVIDVRIAMMNRMVTSATLSRAGDISRKPEEEKAPPVRTPKPPTREELAALIGLTDQQKQDLLARKQANLLTEEEKRKYRLLLFPDEIEETTEGKSDLSPDPTANLTEQQKQDLIQRLQRNMLTPEEQTRYRDYLGKLKKNRDSGNASGSVSVEEDLLLPSGRMRTDRRDVSRGQEDASGQDLNSLPPLDAYRQIADPLSTILQQVVASVPASYQLSGGDSLTIRYWSPTMDLKEITVAVDPSGGITIPDLGRIIVRGQTLAQAEEGLRARLRRSFRDADVSLALKELRTIPVTVSGESYYPGTRQVPAIATAFNLLYATGGPTESGSLRRIEVRRRGRMIATLDMYKFLITGDQTADIQLEPGDVIYIPGRYGRVSVRGEVRRPAVYELLENETLTDAIRYAGGANPSGVTQRVQVTTLQPGMSRLIKDVDLSLAQSGQPVPLYDGDTVDVFSVRSTLVNKVTIEGAVDQPGEYAITPNMTVADLVQRSRGLLDEAYPMRADLFRYNPDNTLTLIPINLEKAMSGDAANNLSLLRWDRLRVYTREEVAWTGQREVRVLGAVRRHGIYYRSDNMRVKDLLIQAGGTLPEAYEPRAVLLHQRPDGTYEYEFINLAEARSDNPKHNVLLQDRDVLAVYRQDEARFTPEPTFSIQGEVVSPGVYIRGRGMRLSDAVALAGGLKPGASAMVLVARARSSNATPPIQSEYSPATKTFFPDPEIEEGDLITIQGRGDYREKPAVVTVSGAVNNPGPIILNGPRVRLTDIVKQAGGLRPEAFLQGAEFYRNPVVLATQSQKQIADIISKLSDLLNQSQYRRELARSDIERLRAAGIAARSSTQLNIPGVPAPSDPGLSAAATAQGTTNLFNRELVSAPRALTQEDLQPKGNVAINLAAALQKPGGEDDIVLLDGDNIIIPEKPTTVQVIGAVFHPRGVLHREGVKLDYYITQCGGYAPDAAKDRVLVIRLGGGLTPINKVKSFLPGDVILVPTQVLAAKLSTRNSDIDNIFRNITNTSVILLVAKKLLGL
jgi:protein involved in polysaccharide export with SLBB domain